MAILTRFFNPDINIIKKKPLQKTKKTILLPPLKKQAPQQQQKNV